jgi:hypothetical protein
MIGRNSAVSSASPPKPPSISRRNAPHPTTRKRPRETLQPLGREPRAFFVSGWGRRDRQKANLRKFRGYSSDCRNQKYEAISGGFVAGGPGFEPRLTESESAVLPLNYPPPAPRPLFWIAQIAGLFELTLSLQGRISAFGLGNDSTQVLLFSSSQTLSLTPHLVISCFAGRFVPHRLRASWNPPRGLSNLSSRRESACVRDLVRPARPHPDPLWAEAGHRLDFRLAAAPDRDPEYRVVAAPVSRPVERQARSREVREAAAHSQV